MPTLKITSSKQPRRRSPIVWIVAAAIGLAAMQLLLTWRASPQKLAYSEFKQSLAQGKVALVRVSPSRITGEMKPEGGKPKVVFTVVRLDDKDLVSELQKQGVRAEGEAESSFWPNLMMWALPIGLFFLWSGALRRGGAGGGNAMFAAGRSKAKVYMEKDVGVSFADVAGVDEAKEELVEVIEFLRHPEKFGRLGGKMPKGILLVGPPGTGKTLLARAIAGEAGVPFFSISGSEFVELFVGVGAARVRDLFTQARELAPCIIFIDELDALGKARGVGPMAHEEREQTLNQLLVEMDGFDPRSGVILMAATNRPEILDPALLRAGRFDRQVLVDRPDKPGRLAILKVHARGVPIESEADLEVVAAMTAGFVGADLANLINEAALLSVRRGKDSVGMSELQEAVERIVTGLEKRNRVLNKMEKERVAHHEVGHALVALAIPGQESVQKISIIPRGISALGYTLQLPTEDRFLMTQAELENKIAVLLGGRVAEELIFGSASTGAQDDLLKATHLARSMVRNYGMSPLVGPLGLDRDRPSLFIGQGMGGEHEDGYSEQTRRHVDAEVRRIVDEQQARVRALLQVRRPLLARAAGALLTRETLSGEELKAIAAELPQESASTPPADGSQVVAG